ncbi:hypothetical protein RvY_12066 [Ramazzottius varieornatus]|uniref:Uncharacterized protein n=1 Tax=Ramazzottius varieornatus TaxID=947166 RepID=A0A1D1VNM5_RAMVA|nr:hypothetical protein RvY_12066 [Ramazzottius varieornatus]
MFSLAALRIELECSAQSILTSAELAEQRQNIDVVPFGVWPHGYEVKLYVLTLREIYFNLVCEIAEKRIAGKV